MSDPVVVNEEWCKGCNVCVEFCPTNVFDLIKGKAVASRMDDCTGCMMCEIHCPDFAIKVYREYAKGRKKKSA
jgi:2-oxoglutarate ferredoxin oxidoreductase subunit delta